MKKVYKYILFFSVFFLPLLSFSQEAAKKDDKQAEPKTTSAQHRAAKRQWKESRKAERDQKKMVEDHDKRLQTKTVRKRMKKDKKKAQDLHDNKRPSIWKRWFSKS